MHNFRELNIWKNGLKLSTEVLKTTKSFPDIEKFSLVSQMNRSAISIPSNIAEGSARTSDKEFNRFLDIALGSSYELETQLIIADKLGYLKEEEFILIQNDLNELQKMIVGFKKTLT